MFNMTIAGEKNWRYWKSEVKPEIVRSTWYAKQHQQFYCVFFKRSLWKLT